MPIQNGKGSLYGAISVKVWCHPTEEKVCTALETNSPSTPTEVERFFGTVGISARLISNLGTIVSLYNDFQEWGTLCLGQ